MRKLGLALLPLVAGCATVSVSPAVEPVVCVASFKGAGGPLTRELALGSAGSHGLRNLRTLSREDFSAAGCDVLVAVSEGAGQDAEPGAAAHRRNTGTAADCGFVAYSAHTRRWISRSIATAPGCERLVENLRAAVQPGDRSHSLIGSGGVPLTLSEVDALVGPVPGRAELASKTEWRETAPLAYVAGRREAPSAAPAAAAAPESPREPVSDVDSPPAQGPVARGHAVVIGIERYRESLPRADFAARDARVTAEYAKRVLGYPEANVAVLLDDRATRGDFEKYFERWLANRVEKDDEVFVYFSGHGAPDLKTGDGYLVPYDGDPTYIEQTGYSLKRMYEALSKLPAKKVTVALDSCFSGAGGRSVIAKGARPLVAVTQSAVPAGLTVLSASAGDQTSNSLQAQGHGLFTYFFLRGLKEKGADFKAVFDYLKPEVAKVARREYNADQDPQWREGR